MSISIFELFKVGLGPSSSHTVGPMLVGERFASALVQQLNTLQPSCFEGGSLTVTLFGALSLTGKGHATDRAVTLGLSGCLPAEVQPDEAAIIWQTICSTGVITVDGLGEIPFDVSRDIVFVNEALPEHPNGMTLSFSDEHGKCLLEQTWFSLGGGFIARKDEFSDENNPVEAVKEPLGFESAAQLLELCKTHQLSMAELVRQNEHARGRDDQQINKGLDAIWQVMEACIDRGCQIRGELPGGLQVQRRAPDLFKAWQEGVGRDPLSLMDVVSLYAMAVNEENAAGSRVVTAPTNGAAGVIPAVLAFYLRHCDGESPSSVYEFLLTAGAIGMLYKRNASISAAEVGCQGEIGVASSMAAAGLTAVWGGSMEQVENAAEIAMEHHLGMTCDPVAGLVQVPCIERNSMGAIKAIGAARLALGGDGRHRVSLDQVIATMFQTGQDMQDRYKETSLGGLAVNVVFC